MIPIALGVIVLVIISVLWAEGIDYMKENHPDYKGEDFFGEEEELKDWDVTVGDGIEGDEYTKQQRNIKAMKEEQKKILIDMMKLDEESGLYDDIEINRIALICKDCGDSLEDCTCIEDTIDFPKQEDEFCYYSGLPSPTAYSKEEIKLEEVFNDEKKENIKKFIDEINNPSEPNQALKDAAHRYEKYSERFDNDKSAIGNPQTWGKRLICKDYNEPLEDCTCIEDTIDFPKQETLEEAGDRELSYINDVCSKNIDFVSGFRLGMLLGAKWQQERSYSEEDLKTAFLNGWELRNGDLRFNKAKNKWFNEFKNK